MAYATYAGFLHMEASKLFFVFILKYNKIKSFKNVLHYKCIRIQF